MKSPDEASFLNNLSANLTGHPSGKSEYEAEALTRGLEIESGRLGSRRFIVVVNQDVFDLDGLTQYVYLMESFDVQRDAEAYAERLKATLMRRQCTRDESSRNTWLLESEGEIRSMPNPKLSTSLRPLYDRTYKLRASPFDTKYTCVRVVGPFMGPIIDLPLFEFINARFELWSYFVDVGRSDAGRGSAPVPF